MADDYVTKKDLEEFGDKFEAKLDNKLQTLKDQLVEAIRDAQTEVLRGFHAHQVGMDLRLRKIEADHSNLDAAATGRLANLEQRVFEIEKKLMMGGGPH